MIQNLYYNCEHPDKILLTRTIKSSKVFTGVSMSSEFNLASHGPFKISFRQSPWFDQFIEVQYRNQSEEVRNEYFTKYSDPRVFGRVWKNTNMFADEKEYYSPTEVAFRLEDIVSVIFMTNAPRASKTKLKLRKQVHYLVGNRYREESINDPYLLTFSSGGKSHD